MSTQMKIRSFTFRLFCLSMVLLLGIFSTAMAENLLENGSFEALNAEGMPLGWDTEAYVLDEGYTVFAVSTDDAVDGDSSAMIRNIGENDARFAQVVPVEPESLYCFSGYIRTEDVEGGRGANLSIEGLYVFSESVFDTSDGWQYIEWYGETGEDQYSATLYARLGGYSGESIGRAWFDDLRLEKVNAVPGSGIASRWYQERTISYYDEDEEPADENSASPAWPRLIMLTLLYTLIAVLLIQWLRRRPAHSLASSADKKYQLLLIAGLVLSFVLRMILSWFVLGYMVDVNCFTSWGNTMFRVGPVNFYPETNFCDYPPAYTYILGLNAWVCSLFPGISPGAVRMIYRFIPALCDLLSCLVLDRFLRVHQPDLKARDRVVGILLLAFHPVTIMNSSAWGQMDSALTLLLLLVAIWAIEGQWHLCLPCYMLAVLVKPQALMLGFLGLTAIIFAWIREKQSRRKILTGAAAAAGVLLVIVVPFTIKQNPFWIVDQYAGTLASYPYATVNTANLYYLLNGNWDKIANAAPLTAGMILASLCLVYGAVLYLRGRNKWTAVWADAALSAIFAAGFVVMALIHASWSLVGTGAMAFAFVIVLSLYIRRGDIRFLPYLGGLLFMILYVFGVKMHERYIFPAFLLLSLAYGLKQDRRILLVLLTLTCTTFINEGIVLDNSIRLGSSLGHLNHDTYVLAIIISAVNCLITIYAVHLGVDLALAEDGKKGISVSSLVKDWERDNLLHWNRKDSILLAVILAVYSIVSFGTLGSTKAPQTAWTSTEYTENIVLDLGEHHDSFDMLYFCRVSRYDFSVASSEDGTAWEDETWAQMDQGQCWKWKYVTDSTEMGNGTRSYGSGRHWFSGRYVRITAHQINLALCEVIFRDEMGNILPIASIERFEGDSSSSLYSDPSLVMDEQDTFEAMPVYFATSADGLEGEDNPRVAQPSWWNSTYFDEIYHARTAWEFLVGSSPYETSHPPLGKVLMSWGVAIFGMTPFGWRFAGAVAGVAMLAVIYLLTKQMTKRTSLSAFACALFALDCMHLTQTQIATIDSFPVLFILLSFFFMLRFLQTDFTKAKRVRVLIDLGLSGLAMGLAIASKWIGIYAGAGLAVLFFWHGFRTVHSCRMKNLINQAAQNGKTGENHQTSALRTFIGYCLWCLLFFVAVPLCIYLASYIPYFAYRHFTNFRDYLEAVINSQQGMFNYHSTPGLGMDHPFYSPWYEWPIIGKPMFYSTKQYIFNDDLSFSIFCIGNPVIWWLGIPALVFCAWAWVRNRNQQLDRGQDLALASPASLDTNLVVLLVGFLAQYLPWTLVPRGTYIYHYFASVPFLILAITLFGEQLTLRNRRGSRVFLAIFAFCALTALIIFFPYVTGIMAPVEWLNIGRNMLRIWY